MRKFEVGDVVRIVKSFWEWMDDSSNEIGEIAVVIEISSSGNVFLGYFDGNETGWWSPDKLEFIAHSEKAYQAHMEICREIDDERNHMRGD